MMQKIKERLQAFYWWLWFHTEWHLTPIDRRPYTYIMRDFFNLQPAGAWHFVIDWYIGMGFLVHYCPVAGAILIGASAFVLAHVTWGAPWIEGQQENPPYLGERWNGEQWVEA